MAVDRRDPERLLIRRQEQAARPRSPKPQHRWPASGEFVPPPRSGSRTATTRFIDLTRQPSAEASREPPLRFVRAAEAVTHTHPSGVSWPPATPTPPTPETPPGTPPGSRKGHANMLTGKALKVTVVLNVAEVAALVVRDGQPRVVLTIEVAGRTLTADISAKAARRAITAIEEHGVDGVACVLQGKLVGDSIEDAGLAVQPKVRPGGEAA